MKQGQTASMIKREEIKHSWKSVDGSNRNQKFNFSVPIFKTLAGHPGGICPVGIGNVSLEPQSKVELYNSVWKVFSEGRGGD